MTDSMDFVSSIRGFLAQARLVSNLFVPRLSPCTIRHVTTPIEGAIEQLFSF